MMMTMMMMMMMMMMMLMMLMSSWWIWAVEGPSFSGFLKVSLEGAGNG